MKLKGRTSVLDFFHDEIKELKEKGVSVMAISKIINPKLPRKLTYMSYLQYCRKYDFKEKL